ncbi:TRAP transporter large permease [Pseudemcibacter aquimaris]|uniref:TRAP transporter large permease n=1 Tax=Pseudemcibacter aquimaris TaxID=2857064 RepID=UPI003B82DF1E
MPLDLLLCSVMFLLACGSLLVGYPVAFTLPGISVIFAGLGYAFGIFDMSIIGGVPQRIYGTMTNVVMMAVPLFVFMGVMLERSQIAEDLLESMGQLMGRIKGGLGISVTIVGALLAASTGIVGATVVIMGLMALPTMLNKGYSPAVATGGIAAAGTLGQIIPPSIVLVLLGDQLSSAWQASQLAQGNFAPTPLSVGDLFAGALIPGLGLVLLYILYQVLVAVFFPKACPPTVDSNEKIDLKPVLAAFLPPIILVVAVLGSILGGIATPTEAAALGAVGAILMAGYKNDKDNPMPVVVAGGAIFLLLLLGGLFDLRMGREEIPVMDYIAFAVSIPTLLAMVWGLFVSFMRVYRNRVIHEVVQMTAKTSSMIFIIMVGAALFTLIFLGFNGDYYITEFLTNLPGGRLGAFVLVMLVMFALGFFLDFIQIVFVVVPIVAPVLFLMDINPIWLGVMMAMNLQTSFLTPPFGYALFYLRGVAPEDRVKTTDIYKGVMPFILIQVLALVILYNFEGLVTWLPELIFGTGL